MNDTYIDRIKEKLELVNDSELSALVNKLIAERNELLESVNIDSLTSVYNRKILEYITDYSVVVMCDIDDFKRINDKFGHDVGDVALKVVAKAITNNVRFDDVVCRYGGDEFLIIFRGCSKEVVLDRIKKIQDDIRHPLRKEKLSLSISAGIANRENNETLRETITNADIALYESKGRGKDTVTLYNKNEQILKK